MLRSTSEVRRALGWLLGGASQAGWTAILAMLPYLVIGLGILIIFGYRLNLLQFGDDQAQHMGVNVNRTKTILLVASSLATAAAVVFPGIIGFIGLVVPHIMRLWFGADYRKLIRSRSSAKPLCTSAFRHSCTHRARPARDSRWHHHSIGWRSFLLVGLASRQKSRILVNENCHSNTCSKQFASIQSF